MKQIINLNIEVEGSLTKALAVASKFAVHIKETSGGEAIVLGINVYKAYEPVIAVTQSPKA